jgi:uncharacterized protein YjbI with pentapeptide repeats
VTLDGADLPLATLARADLTSADLTGATLIRAYMTRTTIAIRDAANIGRAQLSSSRR